MTRLESALYQSATGLSANGQAISVIGDNIANANTIGYRASRIIFADLVAGGKASNETKNIPSVGSGVGVAGIKPRQETGLIEDTGRDLDIAIEGRGFIMVGDPANPSYTRAGVLAVNKDGILVNASGEQVLGFAGGDDGTLSTLNVSDFTLGGTATSALGVFGNLNSGAESAEVPADPATFNEINQLAAFVTNPSVYDSLGARHDITLAYYKTDTNTWAVQAYIDGEDVGGEAGKPTKIGNQLTLNFGSDGVIPEANRAAAVITATPAYSNGAAAGNFTISLGGFTQFAGTSQVVSLTNDGQGVGNVQNYEIRDNGEFFANLDSGQNVQIGTLQLADFNNVDALQRAGNGLFVATAEAGDRRLGQPGVAGLGTLAGGSLERSTTDLANQFVDMVLYQRGYQASSQTLSTAAQLIKDTLALIR